MIKYNSLLDRIKKANDDILDIESDIVNILKEHLFDDYYEIEWNSLELVLINDFNNRYSIQTLLELIEMNENKEIILEKARII